MVELNFTNKYGHSKSDVMDAQVIQRLEECTRNNEIVTQVKLCNCSNITDASVTALLPHCHQLTKLSLSNCPNITKDGHARAKRLLARNKGDDRRQRVAAHVDAVVGVVSDAIDSDDTNNIQQALEECGWKYEDNNWKCTCNGGEISTISPLATRPSTRRNNE